MKNLVYNAFHTIYVVKTGQFWFDWFLKNVIGSMFEEKKDIRIRYTKGLYRNN